MKFEESSSGVAKAGLTTGIIGTSLGALNMLNNGGGLLGGLVGNNRAAATAWAFEGGCCSDDRLVNRYELGQQQKISELETQIALRDANIFTDQKSLEMYQYVDGRLREIERQICLQAVENQKTVDSFQLVNERLQCCCNNLTNQLQAETNARMCSDNTIVNYANATFYPKQVADVTTGTTTTPQNLYNPIPYQPTINCNCGC